MTNTQIIRSLRLIASFALLGAVIVGAATGWVDNQHFDYRVLGALAGGAFAIFGKMTHFI